MYDRRLLYAKEVLRYAELRAQTDGDLTYIICGRAGPTGKTWLTNELRSHGHNAFEISEELINFVDYRDNENHMLTGHFGAVIIILNKPLNEMWKL